MKTFVRLKYTIYPELYPINPCSAGLPSTQSNHIHIAIQGNIKQDTNPWAYLFLAASEIIDSTQAAPHFYRCKIQNVNNTTKLIDTETDQTSTKWHFVVKQYSKFKRNNFTIKMYFTIVGKELNTTSKVQYWSSTLARRYSFPSKNDDPEYKLYTLELIHHWAYNVLIFFTRAEHCFKTIVILYQLFH